MKLIVSWTSTFYIFWWFEFYNKWFFFFSLQLIVDDQCVESPNFHICAAPYPVLPVNTGENISGQIPGIISVWCWVSVRLILPCQVGYVKAVIRIQIESVVSIIAGEAALSEADQRLPCYFRIEFWSGELIAIWAGGRHLLLQGWTHELISTLV